MYIKDNGKLLLGFKDGFVLDENNLVKEEDRIYMEPSMCNRHGLIAGASGTGKTITMKVMAESFSDAGVPVFLCDVKGDVSGIAQKGESSEGMEKRIDKFGLRDIFSYCEYPVTFWDIYQEGGHPVRATVSDMGPDILASLLELTDVQAGVLNIAFRVADDQGLIIDDLKDLKIVLNYVCDNKEKYMLKYGTISPQSVGVIMRAIVALENQGGDNFFGRPELDINDWMRCDDSGRGMINVFHSVKLIQNPKTYAAFMLWMMAELFESMPEAGDLDKPKIVFFFDEAHLLFNGAPKSLVNKIEQLVKLIRSKGVGIYFVTQNPSDIPDSVLAQLSNRVQHALRAYTPAEQKAVKAAAASFRVNPEFKTEDVIMELGVGEALVSVLDEGGVPGVVQKTKVICPQSLMAPCTADIREICIKYDGMDKYDEAIDPVSAYETLTEAIENEQKEAEEKKAAELAEKEEAKRVAEEQKAAEKALKQREKAVAQAEVKAKRREAQIERQLINIGGQVLKRGILNTLFK